MLALCPACGARFNYPFVTEEMQERADAEAAAAAARRPNPWKKAEPWIWAGAATIVIGLIIALIWAVMVLPGVFTARTEAADILHNAKDLADQGHYTQARDKYLELVNKYPSPPGDGKLADEIDFARQQASVMDERASHQPPPPPPPPPPAVAVITPAPSASQTRPAASQPAVASVNLPPGPGTPVPATQPVALASLLPPIKPLPPSGGLTDAQIDDSVRHAVDYVMTQMDQDRFEVKQGLGQEGAYHSGLDALCVYALIMAGQTIDDPRLSERGPFIQGCLDRLKVLPCDGHWATYARIAGDGIGGAESAPG